MTVKTVDKVTSDIRQVCCQGEDNALGHPLVYLNINEEDIRCPYCSRKFVLKTE